MITRISHLRTIVSLAGAAVLLGVLSGLLPASGARALEGVGHGPGYMSTDGWWLGTYRLDDGAQGFCLNAGKPSPTGHTLDYADGAGLGWYTPEQGAQLAYISRNWAGTDDRLTAAAGQLATWLVAGLGGHSLESVAARAGADADAAIARARQMKAEAESRGSTGVHAEALVELAETGPGRVRVEVTVARLSGAELLAPGAHAARVTLTGATFEDGSTTSAIPTGTDVPIVPTGSEASVSVTATAALQMLPYGGGLRVAVPHDDAQALLVAVPATATAEAGASVTGPSPLPFQPTVTTVTSAAEAAPGTAIVDHLTVGVATGDGLLPTWPVRGGDDGFEAVEVVVESRLLGPFPAPIEQAPAVPADAPEVCAVSTTVTGTGDYTTPECTVPEPGYYVWVERIDPGAVPPELGGERVREWQSGFGVAEEVTRVLAPVVTHVVPPAPTPTPVAPAPPAAPVAPAVVDAPTMALAETGTDMSPAPVWIAAGAVAAGGLMVSGGALVPRGSRVRRGLLGVVGRGRRSGGAAHVLRGSRAGRAAGAADEVA
ncbi:hypothetical protein P5G50_16955 [Leifsonia sp. F6_8S_P_1B]|uniref:TQXA domain-containing protein n=1 Tax=Leifsonia williamsii TaxID=3035919 RepID=A0ABT8KIL1_9MICO|nr:hypothetical protein [Leifsonia williamsii]MDN4616139.1 hypothetical protein [Leifsonia williamsii]